MADESDYYAMLGVEPGADDEELRQAYRRLAWRYHPDRAGPESAERMRLLNVAYQTLSDPERRRIYDAQRPATAGWASPSTSSASGAAASGASGAAGSRVGSRVGSRDGSEGPLRLLLRLAGPEDASLASATFTRDGLFVGAGLRDGRVLIWSLLDGHLAASLAYGPQAGIGVLQEVRLSPRGSLAAAWGYSLGLRVWSVTTSKTIWNTSMSAPSGAMDAILLDEPPLIRLALPDAPLALADDDPYRWAEQGKRGTAVFARPLVGQVNPAWAVPFHCVESGAEGLLREPPDANWRAQRRILSSDGALLLTYATGAAARLGKGNFLRLWDLHAKTLRGVTEPKRIEQVMESTGMLHYPLTATHDLAWIAIGSVNRQLRLFALRGHQQRVVEIGALPQDALAALTPDGARVALARGARLNLYDTQSNRELQEWTFGDEITTLAYSPNPARPLLAVGLRNGLAEIWGA